MTNLFLRIAAIAMVLGGSSAYADFFVRVGSDPAPTFNAGSTGTLSVFGYHSEGSPISLDNTILLGFDITPAGSPPTQNGNTMPSFFSGFTGANSIFTGQAVNTTTTQTNRDNYDLRVQAVFGGTPLISRQVWVISRSCLTYLSILPQTRLLGPTVFSSDKMRLVTAVVVQ